MDADAALRAIMDAIEIDTVAEAPAVSFTPVGLADLAHALADMIEAARTEGEAAGYRRAIDEVCAAIGAENKQATQEHRENSDFEWRSWNYGRLSTLREMEHAMRALAPVEPVSPADELPGC